MASRFALAAIRDTYIRHLADHASLAMRASVSICEDLWGISHVYCCLSTGSFIFPTDGHGFARILQVALPLLPSGW